MSASSPRAFVRQGQRVSHSSFLCPLPTLPAAASGRDPRTDPEPAGEAGGAQRGRGGGAGQGSSKGHLPPRSSPTKKDFYAIRYRLILKDYSLN